MRCLISACQLWIHTCTEARQEKLSGHSPDWGSRRDVRRAIFDEARRSALRLMRPERSLRADQHAATFYLCRPCKYEADSCIHGHNPPDDGPLLSLRRWSAASASVLSPAHSADPETITSWVGIIMYLPSESPGMRGAITRRRAAAPNRPKDVACASRARVAVSSRGACFAA